MQWIGTAPLALSSQRVQTLVGAMGSAVLTATAIAGDAITAAKIAADALGASELAADAATEIATAVWALATRQLTGTQAFNLTGNITGNLSGSVGSVTGAVGSVTGAVGSVTGAVGSVTGNVGGNVAGSVASVTAGVSLADDAITAAKFDEATAFPLAAADSGASQVARVGADGDTLETLSDQLDAVAPPSAATIADAVWDEAIADHDGAGSTGEALAGATAPSAADVADAVWDEAIADHDGAGSTGLSLAGASAPSAADVADAVWDETIADHDGVGSTGAALAAAGGSGDPWSTALPGAYGAGTAGNIIGNNLDAAVSDVPTAVENRTEIDSNSTQLAAIVADTDELQQELADGGRTDLLIDAILADTNELQTDDVPGLIAALNDPTAAAVADAVWDEAKGGHVAAGSFGEEVQAHSLSTEISGLNDLSSADAQTAAAAALTAYDPPTKGELDSGLAALNDLDAAGVRGAVGLAAANLDTQLGALPTAAENLAEIDSNSTQLAAIVADTNELQAELADGGRTDLLIDAILADTAELQTDDVPGLIAALENLSAAEINAEVVDALTVDVIADSVAADGSRPTISQALLMIARFLMEKDVTGTTLTVNKEDGSTSSMTFTLDSETAPTAITRAS